MNRYIALAAAALFCSGAAIGQGSSGGGTTGAQATSPSSGAKAAGKTSTGAGSATMVKADSKMLTDLAEANIAEIETGKLALQKAKGDDAKSFAQKMIDDHTAALSKVQALAQSKGVQLPQETDVQHKATAKALGALSGDAFDAQYLKRVGVSDHERTIQLLQKAQKQAKDPELKAMAAEMLPTVQQHLQMAKQSTATSKQPSTQSGTKASSQSAKQ